MTTTSQSVNPVRQLPVRWSDRAWTPRIVARATAGLCELWNPRAPRQSTCRVPRNRAQAWTFKRVNLCSMRTFRHKRGFTLIELLVVIAIIAILAGLLLPALAKVKLAAKKQAARSEMAGLAAAFAQYETEYHRLPSPGPTGPRNDQTGAGDFTYGFTLSASGGDNASTNSNDIPIAILKDYGAPVNTNHVRNPHQTDFYNTTHTASDVNPGLTHPPGFSTVDFQLRDPFGSPYVITLDFDGDGKCNDALYGLPTVSAIGTTGAYNGLVDKGGGGAGPFLANGSVFIWSWGPDKAATNIFRALDGVNKDNIINGQ